MVTTTGVVRFFDDRHESRCVFRIERDAFDPAVDHVSTAAIWVAESPAVLASAVITSRPFFFAASTAAFLSLPKKGLASCSSTTPMRNFLSSACAAAGRSAANAAATAKVQAARFPQR